MLRFDLLEGAFLSSTMHDYTDAKIFGETVGQCNVAYAQCPFSAFNVLDDDLLYAFMP